MTDLEMLKVGDTIDKDKAIRLCRDLCMFRTLPRLADADVKPFVFDACSYIPDRFLCFFSDVWTNVVYRACLPHDLRYYAGDLRNNKKGVKDRRIADRIFYNDLIACGVSFVVAKGMLKAVRLFGGPGKGSFAWGFGHGK